MCAYEAVGRFLGPPVPQAAQGRVGVSCFLAAPYPLTHNPWTTHSVAHSRLASLARSLNLNSPPRTRTHATGHETMANGLARTLVHDVSHDTLQMLIKTSRWPNRDLALTLRPAGLAAPSPTAPLPALNPAGDTPERPRPSL